MEIIFKGVEAYYWALSDSAVRGGVLVIIAKYVEVGTPVESYLGNLRHQLIGDALIGGVVARNPAYVG